MDICRSLDRELSRTARVTLPPTWLSEPALARHTNVDRLVIAARHIGEESDDVVRALLSVADATQLADCILVGAMVALVRARCKRGVILVDDLIAEVAIAVAEARRDGLPRTERHLVNVLLDKAWDRACAPYQRARQVVPVAPDRVASLRGSDDEEPERVVVNRVAVAALRADLQRRAGAMPSAVRAWNSAVELVDVPRKSRVQLDRWKYVRAQLRRQGSPDLAA
jgi:hypothetical protein